MVSFGFVVAVLEEEREITLESCASSRAVGVGTADGAGEGRAVGGMGERAGESVVDVLASLESEGVTLRSVLGGVAILQTWNPFLARI